MPGIASSSPPVLLAHLASVTSTIRLGSGGLMLPNHASLAVAEQFGMLEALHPGRIDLGIGRAPGTDPMTARALRRSPGLLGADDFPEQLTELLGYFSGALPEGHPYAHINAVPARGLQPGHLVARLEHVQRARGRTPRHAVLVRVPLRAGRAHGGAGRVPNGVPSVARSRGALRDARSLGGGCRVGGACAVARGPGRAGDRAAALRQSRRVPHARGSSRVPASPRRSGTSSPTGPRPTSSARRQPCGNDSTNWSSGRASTSSSSRRWCTATTTGSSRTACLPTRSGSPPRPDGADDRADQRNLRGHR